MFSKLNFVRRADWRVRAVTTLLLIIVAALFLVPTVFDRVSASPEQVTSHILYGAGRPNYNAPSTLYKLNPSNGGAQPVGLIGYVTTALAVDPNTGVMYGATGNLDSQSCYIIKVNKTTGVGTPVGPEVNGCIADLAFTPGGALYGLSGYDHLLYRINKSTGYATSQGDTGQQRHYGNGIAVNPLNGRMYGAPDGDQRSLFVLGYHGGSTAVSVLHGGPSSNCFSLPVSALDYNSAGVLYGSIINYCTPEPHPSYLVTISVSSGAIHVLGQSVGNLDAIAFDR